MAFDLDGFLKELGVSGEEEATAKAFFGKPERVAALEKGYLRQADYSKQSDKLTKAQADLQASIERLNAEQVEWAGLTAREQDAAKELRASIEKEQAKNLSLTQRVQRIAAEAGLDPTKALEGIDQAPPQREEPKVAAVDTSKFVGTEQFGTMSEYLFNLSTELPLIAQEHFDLTGERLDTRALRAEIQTRANTKGANLDPRVIWEDKFGIQAKREERTATQRKAEIEAAEQRGYERSRTEAALPIPPSNGLHSPVLRGVDGNARTSVLQRPAAESGVRSAAAALASGKYRQATTAQK